MHIKILTLAWTLDIVPATYILVTIPRLRHRLVPNATQTSHNNEGTAPSLPPPSFLRPPDAAASSPRPPAAVVASSRPRHAFEPLGPPAASSWRRLAVAKSSRRRDDADHRCFHINAPASLGSRPSDLRPPSQPQADRLAPSRRSRDRPPPRDVAGTPGHRCAVATSLVNPGASPASLWPSGTVFAPSPRAIEPVAPSPRATAVVTPSCQAVSPSPSAEEDAAPSPPAGDVVAPSPRTGDVVAPSPRTGDVVAPFSRAGEAVAPFPRAGEAVAPSPRAGQAVALSGKPSRRRGSRRALSTSRASCRAVRDTVTLSETPSRRRGRPSRPRDDLTASSWHHPSLGTLSRYHRDLGSTSGRAGQSPGIVAAKGRSPGIVTALG